MTNEITREQMIISLRNGIEIWVDKDKAIEFGEDWVRGLKATVKLEGRYVNTVDIIGIFPVEDLEHLKKERRGMWICKYKHWHNKNDYCECGRQH